MHRRPLLLALLLPTLALAGEGSVLDGITAEHNRVRAAHGVGPLVWDDGLAAFAGQWADQLASSGCDMRHRPDNDYGENLYWGSANRWSDGRVELQAVGAERVVGAWAAEERDYDYSANRCASGKQCGHYTQVVWAHSARLGCARAVCADQSQVWVCNYDPPGNYVGVKPY